MGSCMRSPYSVPSNFFISCCMYERPPAGPQERKEPEPSAKKLIKKLHHIGEVELYGAEGSIGYVLNDIVSNLASDALRQELSAVHQAELDTNRAALRAVAERIMRLSAQVGQLLYEVPGGSDETVAAVRDEYGPDHFQSDWQDYKESLKDYDPEYFTRKKSK